jgi:hypothetical protein
MNGIPERHWQSADGRSKITQIILPGSRLNVLTERHGRPPGGHLSVNATRIRSDKGTTGSRQETTLRSNAGSAASRGPRTRNRGQMHQYNVGAPFERTVNDVAGPFPRSDQGNRYLLIATDYFIKWPEAYTIPNQEASTVAEALVTNFFCRFGVPQGLHSDQGRYFKSHLMQLVLQRLGVDKTRSTPLHPQSAGMVERYIKTVEEHLQKVVASHQKDWDARLPNFLLAYRAFTHDTTGPTLASLVFARELRLSCDLPFGAPPPLN